MAAAKRTKKPKAKGDKVAPRPTPLAPMQATADELPARGEEGYPIEEPARWEHLRDLRPWRRNPRFIDEADVEEAVESFLRFGFGAPMLVWREQDMLVAGHARRLGVLRLLSGKALAPIDKVDGVVVHLTGAERPDLYSYEVVEGRIAAGSFRFAGAPGPGFVPVRRMPFAGEDEAVAYALRDNNGIGSPDEAAVIELREELERRGTHTAGLGFDEASDEALRARLTTQLDEDLIEDSGSDAPTGSSNANALPVLVFERSRLPMSESEAERLRVKIQAFADEHGSLHGAAGRMIDAL